MVTFTYHFTPKNRDATIGFQLYVHRDDIRSEEKWVQIFPRDAKGAPLILTLHKGANNTGFFTLPLAKGVYGAFRLIMFEAPDGKNIDFGRLLYDTGLDKLVHLNLNLTVSSSEVRVTTPRLNFEEPRIEANADGTYQIAFDGRVEMPNSFQAEQNGFFVMTKGSCGFAQAWVSTDEARTADSEENPYLWMPFHLVVSNVKPGKWNAQFGLFKYSWGDPLQWTYPGIDFETGGDAWEQRAPANRMPPRLRVRNGRFVRLNGSPYNFYPDHANAMRAVSFVRGGNYGNALTWTIDPVFDRPGYFTQLYVLGCRFMRLLFSPERYLKEAVYRDSVDQVVQNIWAAGLFPIVSPQGLAQADTRREQVQRSLDVVRMLAARYRQKPVWLEICNEPSEFGAWMEWKPVAIDMVRIIRSIDPDAFVIVPLEGTSKDARAAAKNPIREVAVDLYDAHAYINPGEVSRNLAPAIQAGLPLMVGEYGGGDPNYLNRLDLAFQRLPGLMAVGPWAFTKQGQDSLPLVEDGSPAPLRLNLNGRQIAADYRLWEQGQRKKAIGN